MRKMKVSELIQILSDVDPDLDVVVRSDDSDYDYQLLEKKQVVVDYSQFSDEDSEGDDIEKQVLIVGDLYS